MSHRSAEGGCSGFLQMQQLHRREFLRVGGLSALGVSLPNVLAREAHASNYLGEAPPARAKACILLFLSGGPSHLETFDPKPLANTDYRTIFPTISTNVPGIQLTEPLAGLARQADRFTLVRSLWHTYGGHFGGHRYALTGHAAIGGPDQPARPDDAPGVQSLAIKHMKPKGSMPSGIMTPWVATDQGSGASGGMNAGTLGRQYDPVMVEADARTLDNPKVMPAFRIPEFALQPGMTVERVHERRDLLGIVDRQRQGLAEAATSRQLNAHYQKAYDLASPACWPVAWSKAAPASSRSTSRAP
jgi:hypothetical protein